MLCARARTSGIRPKMVIVIGEAEAHPAFPTSLVSQDVGGQATEVEAIASDPGDSLDPSVGVGQRWQEGLAEGGARQVGSERNAGSVEVLGVPDADAAVELHAHHAARHADRRELRMGHGRGGDGRGGTHEGEQGGSRIASRRVPMVLRERW